MNKKRKKSSRMRGSHTHKTGFKKKSRGSGHRGGKGMSGTGKRADHRKSLINNLAGKYFGKKSLSPKVKEYKVINLDDIEKISNGKDQLNLEGYKILSRGEISKKIEIHAYSASKRAIEKVEKAGGKIILQNESLEKVSKDNGEKLLEEKEETGENGSTEKLDETSA